MFTDFFSRLAAEIDFDGISAAINAAILFFSISFLFYFVIIAAIVVLYYLNAVGIYKMSVSAGIKNPWFSFIPFFDAIALGRLAEKYQKRNGEKSAKFSVILLVLKIVYELTAFVMVLLMMFGLGNFFVIAIKGILTADSSTAISSLAVLVPFFVSVLIYGLLGIAYSVVYYVAMWRVFGIFDSKNATVYTVLSIFFSFLTPIFVFVLRNKEPRFSYEERIKSRSLNNFHTVSAEPTSLEEENADNGENT